jgi:hypothetical protein
MKIFNKLTIFLGFSCLVAGPAMAYDSCPVGYCPANNKVFTQSGLIQFIIPQGGQDEPTAPYAAPEKFNQEFSTNNWTYDSFLPHSIIFSDVVGYTEGYGCQCQYTFKGSFMNPNGGVETITRPVIIYYVSPIKGQITRTMK